MIDRTGMTRQECIAALHGSMALWIFDPMTGETKDPSDLNETDRMTYEAMRYAANFLEAHPERGAKRYYYTFGTDPDKFPFGIEDFVEVHADTQGQANQKFKAYFPCQPGSTLLNCAFVYNEEKFRLIWKEDYHGKKPAAVIL